jgi:hypothetical protein
VAFPSGQQPLELLELDLPRTVRIDLVDQLLNVDREAKVVLDDLRGGDMADMAYKRGKCSPAPSITN